ncbi:MAG: hypothetical protein ACOX8Q_09810, partial [Christensenellales bacterium]
GLPVLYMTGSLRKTVANAHVSGICFVLYFIFTAALSFIPLVRVVQGISVNVAGAFFCVAPAVYLMAKKRYSYRYYITFVLTTLVTVVLSFLSNAYTLSFLPYSVSIATSFTAMLCFKGSAPVFVPVMVGIYGAVDGVMQLFAGINNSITLFGGIGIVSLSVAICLLMSGLVCRPKGRHAADGGSPIGNDLAQVQHNKG